MFKEYEVLTVDLENGETIAYRKSGNGDQTLVLLHGNMSSSIHFDTIMEALEDKYTIYAVDLRGFGDSTYKNELNSLEDFALDVKLWAEALELNQFSVLGWSTGGGIALELSAMIPHVINKVILLDSVGIKGYPMFKKDANYQPILTELITTKEEIAQDAVQVLPILMAYQTQNKDLLKQVWNAVIYTTKQPDEARYDRYLNEMMKQRNLVDVDYSLVHFNMTNDFNGVNNGSNRLELIECPVLIIHGQNDLVVPVAYALEMKQYLGDKAELHLYENSGHAPVTDEFDRLIEDIIAFID